MVSREASLDSNGVRKQTDVQERGAKVMAAVWLCWEHLRMAASEAGCGAQQAREGIADGGERPWTGCCGTGRLWRGSMQKYCGGRWAIRKPW